MTDAEAKAMYVLEKFGKPAEEHHVKVFKFKTKKEYSVTLLAMKHEIGRDFMKVRLVGYPDEKKIEIYY